MNLWAADHENRQQELVSPGTKRSHRTFPCPRFYGETLALRFYAHSPGCAKTDWLTLSWCFHGFQNPKFLRGTPHVNALRHMRSNIIAPLKFHLNFMWGMSPLSRCSIQKECALGLLTRSWISLGEGPQQCPSMTLTPPEISVSADIKVKSGPCHTWNRAQASVLCCFTCVYWCL